MCVFFKSTNWYREVNKVTTFLWFSLSKSSFSFPSQESLYNSKSPNFLITRFKHLKKLGFWFQDMDAITSLVTSHGFSSFSQENKSKSQLFPVMSLDLKEHPTDFTNQSLTAFTSSSVAHVSKQTKKSLFYSLMQKSLWLL